MKFLPLFICLLLLTTQSTFAGNNNLFTFNNELQRSSLRMDDEFDDDDEKSDIFEDEDWEEFKNFDMEFHSIFKNQMPTIEIQYGFVTPGYEKKEFTGEFNKPNIGEIRLGFTTKKSQLYKSNVFKSTFGYIFLGKISTEWQKQATNADLKISPDCWRFGFGSSKGYGWQLSEKTALTMYNSESAVWSKLEFTGPDAESLTKTFGSQFRFGETTEGGIRFQLIKPLSLNVGYERNMIFPRHMFWYWAGSGIVQAIGDGALDYFIKKVMKASPTAGPVVYFVLKNAYDYGIYELHKKNMNWPFKTAAPFMFDSFKVGASFEF